ncbi:MAG: tyrosine-type recombinase/integrase [Bacteroidetes bacterium]|nr:tyrosine-type recombinase/integrase [Bacteroidota bacterium]
MDGAPANRDGPVVGVRGRGEKSRARRCGVSPAEDGGPLSRSQLWRIVRKATRIAGIKENVSPHWFRHPGPSHALDRGAPAHLVQQPLSHQSLATTSRYTHARPDDSSGPYLGDVVWVIWKEQVLACPCNNAYPCNRYTGPLLHNVLCRLCPHRTQALYI